MESNKFKNEVKLLVDKVKRLRFEEYYKARLVIMEFERMVDTYREYLNPYILEHIDSIKNHLDRSEKYKKLKLKQSNWDDAMRGLQSDIESMDSYETSFPD